MPLTRNLVQINHVPTLGKNVQVYVARLGKGVPISAIVDQTLIVATGGAAALATTITLTTALTGKIFKGQYLCFADANDIEQLALVTADAVVGDTTLTVKALDEAIAATSKAEFPTYLWDRTDASLDQTYANNKTVTFNTGGAQNAVPTTIDRKITLPGEFWHYNAAFRTAAAVADAQEYLYVKRVEPAPNALFSAGDTIEGRALVSSVKSAGQSNSPITGDLEIEFSGPTKKTDPKLVV